VEIDLPAGIDLPVETDLPVKIGLVKDAAAKEANAHLNHATTPEAPSHVRPDRASPNQNPEKDLRAATSVLDPIEGELIAVMLLANRESVQLAPKEQIVPTPALHERLRGLPRNVAGTT
jgi:hypothetical protein